MCIPNYELHKPSLCAFQLYTYIYLLYALSNRQPIKKRLMFLPVTHSHNSI
jgi:hypothetical protein